MSSQTWRQECSGDTPVPKAVPDAATHPMASPACLTRHWSQERWVVGLAPQEDKGFVSLP